MKILLLALALASLIPVSVQSGKLKHCSTNDFARLSICTNILRELDCIKEPSCRWCATMGMDQKTCATSEDAATGQRVCKCSKTVQHGCASTAVSCEIAPKLYSRNNVTCYTMGAVFEHDACPTITFNAAKPLAASLLLALSVLATILL